MVAPSPTSISASPRRELLLRERELERGPGRDGVASRAANGLQMGRDALRDLPEREVAGEIGEAAHAARQGLQEGERHRRLPPAQLEDRGARKKEEARRRHRDRRGDVAAPIEERHFPQGGSRPLGVEALLAARF